MEPPASPARSRSNSTGRKYEEHRSATLGDLVILLLRRRHLRLPMDHLVHDGDPLLPVQPLLDDQVGTVTHLASRMQQPERLTFRRRYFPNSSSDNNGLTKSRRQADADPDQAHDGQ